MWGAFQEMREGLQEQVGSPGSGEQLNPKEGRQCLSACLLNLGPPAILSPWGYRGACQTLPDPSTFTRGRVSPVRHMPQPVLKGSSTLLGYTTWQWWLRPVRGLLLWTECSCLHPPSHPHSYIEALTLSVAVFGDGTSQELRVNEAIRLGL